jgi:hypothetical protein
VQKIYNAKIPSMGGGFSSFLGYRFNQHIPENYDVITILNKDKVLIDMSINEIEQLKKDEKGNYF